MKNVVGGTSTDEDRLQKMGEWELGLECRLGMGGIQRFQNFRFEKCNEAEAPRVHTGLAEDRVTMDSGE